MFGFFMSISMDLRWKRLRLKEKNMDAISGKWEPKNRRRKQEHCRADETQVRPFREVQTSTKGKIDHNSKTQRSSRSNKIPQVIQHTEKLEIKPITHNVKLQYKLKPQKTRNKHTRINYKFRTRKTRNTSLANTGKIAKNSKL